ncbi:hypothetical protein K466DRAFT_659353 [Polyporus arcularius HHB13444]|uniref:HNH nuclease domain-containing protein n=1 Tax=Polyporus arcularius HHB13444 TaxID=1314778 RepID=A0A5C3PV96_9APHY|nr:hypothetical protein K466DRAFT_659353 [Polyporus arcularius HHB13444]
MAIRDPLGPPAQREIRLYGVVDILHPGYEERYLLLQLPALDPVDTPNGEPQMGGVDLRLALDACRVLTNNREGFLSESRNGDNPVQVSGSEELLVQSQYYYHLAGHLGSMYKYPVVTAFAAWTLPTSIPEHWAHDETAVARSALQERFGRPASAMSTAVKNFDGGCVLTKFLASTQNARYVPKEEQAWFDGNHGTYHCLNAKAGINDTANGVTLRSDVHLCFDRGGFVFYPFNALTREYLVYSLSNVESDYTDLLHRRPVTMHERTSATLVYARFAYAVILRGAPGWVGNEVPIRDVVKAVAAQLNSSAKQGPSDSAAARAASFTAASNESVAIYMEGYDEKQWEEGWKERFPKFSQEVEDPPDTWVQSHPDTVRIGRLAAAYKAKNPQIALSSDGSKLHDCDDPVDAVDR